MKWAFCTRSFEYDYEWVPTTGPLTEEAQRISTRLEGSLAYGYFCALLRDSRSCPIRLYATVFSGRKDNVGRLIRTYVCLESENSHDDASLIEFAQRVLNTDDSESLINPGSPFAKALESLVTTKSTEEFLHIFPGESVASPMESIKGRFAYPRTDMDTRKKTADRLLATIQGGLPFSVAIVERFAQDVVEDFGWYHPEMPVLVFSAQTKSQEQLPHKEPKPTFPMRRQKNRTRILLRGAGLLAILLVLVLVMKSCRTSKNSENLQKNIPIELERK